MKSKPIIVVAGAGFAGLKTFQKLETARRRGGNFSLVLLNDLNYFLFTPLLHEVATGNLSPENVIVPLPPLASPPHSRVLVGRLLRLLPGERRLITDRGPIDYDYLVLALGSETNYYNTPGAVAHSLPLKDLDDAARIKNQIITRFEEAQGEKSADRRRELLTFVIVGGGAVGIELAGELADFCHHTFAKVYEPALVRATRIIVIQKDDHILPQFSDGLRRRSLATLSRQGVEVLINTSVVEVEPAQIKLSTGDKIKTANVFWTAGVQARQIEIEPDLPVERGRLLVNKFLQSRGDDKIFVLGDMAAALDSTSKQALPMLAQVADRQALTTANNILNLLAGRPLKPFIYRSRGSLVSLGGWWAAGELFGLHFAGRLTWLLWRAVYFSKMPTLAKKLQIALDWTINAFTPRDLSVLPFTKNNIHKS